MSKKNSVLSRLMPTPQSEPEAQQLPSQFPNLVAEDRHEGGKPMVRTAESSQEAAEQLAGSVRQIINLQMPRGKSGESIEQREAHLES
jgi:hypothetical protein